MSPGFGCCCSFFASLVVVSPLPPSARVWLHKQVSALWFWFCARPVCTKGGKLTTITTSYLAGWHGCSSSRYILRCRNQRETLQPQVKHTKPTGSIQIVKFHLPLSPTHSPTISLPRTRFPRALHPTVLEMEIDPLGNWLLACRRDHQSNSDLISKVHWSLKSPIGQLVDSSCTNKQFLDLHKATSTSFSHRIGRIERSTRGCGARVAGTWLFSVAAPESPS